MSNFTFVPACRPNTTPLYTPPISAPIGHAGAVSTPNGTCYVGSNGIVTTAGGTSVGYATGNGFATIWPSGPATWPSGPAVWPK